MYLLMLLATYLAALYQFNLSARPDYDRDVQIKRAMATVNRFMDQHKAAAAIVMRVIDKDYNGRNTSDAIVYIQPDDLLYVNNEKIDRENQNINLYYYQEITNSGEALYMREYDHVLTPNAYSIKQLRLGKRFYDKDEMASRVICLGNKMFCTGEQEQDQDADGNPKFDIDGNPVFKHENKGCTGVAQKCDVTPYKTGDPSGSTEMSGTCCNREDSKGGIYVISFRKIDIRWFNRVTGEIGREFMKAVEERRYNNNIGIIVWNDDLESWQFTGKMRFGPAYEVEERRWREAHDTPFPTSSMNMTNWVMPNTVFDRDFFKIKLDDNVEVDYCENGCIFSIKEML